MRRALLTLLALLLATGPVMAADRLAEMDRYVQELQGWRFPAGGQPTAGQLSELVELLGELRRLSDRPPPGHADEVRLRLGEGFLQVARALLEVPCPTGLDASACAEYQDLLREQTDPMLLQAEVHFDGVDPAKMPRWDRVRLLEAYQQLALLRGEPTDSMDPPALPDEAPESIDPVRYSLVWADARFVTHRDGSGQELRDREWFDGRDAHLGEVLLVRVVGAADQFTEVEVVPAAGWRHCRADTPIDPAYQVRLLVLPTDLAPVLTTTFEHRWEDGTSVSVRPGAPTAEGRVALDGLVVTLPELPPVQVGVDYLAPPRWRGPQRDLGPLPGTANPTLGGRSVSIVGPRPPAVEAWDDGAGLATFAGPCGTAVVHSDQGPTPGEPEGVVGTLARLSTRRKAVAGTRLYWPDGSVAGTLGTDRTFAEDQLAGLGYRCFATPFGTHREGHRRPDLRLCIEEEDLSPVP